MRETPIYIRTLINLEHRALTGAPARRMNREEEKKWSGDLANRLNKCIEKPTVYGSHTLCDYISFLQYDESGIKHYPPEHEECIASIIKDYLLSSDEIAEYMNYCTRMEKR
jgi:hypothetical protein